MAVGLSSDLSVPGLNGRLGQIAVKVRNELQDARNFFQDVQKLGVAGLQTVGFSAPDAQEFFTEASYLNTVAGVYYGTATQTTLFNFDDGTTQARGGN
jgi:hypothetical protein